ncbi:hypothetical protein SAMN02927921_03862 [Sinomicrobium oceani]|uniref:Uncharacterized protein n=1 Tax=Sinomicrobium oceani TaxID=1150368 RepID=A0A1K1RQZ6_9FLAO|nr:hypothetical protein SAMN02927921_03862 [Sinomicrobium oceani]
MALHDNLRNFAAPNPPIQSNPPKTPPRGLHLYLRASCDRTSHPHFKQLLTFLGLHAASRRAVCIFTGRKIKNSPPDRGVHPKAHKQPLTCGCTPGTDQNFSYQSEAVLVTHHI